MKKHSWVQFILSFVFILSLTSFDWFGGDEFPGLIRGRSGDGICALMSGSFVSSAVARKTEDCLPNCIHRPNHTCLDENGETCVDSDQYA